MKSESQQFLRCDLAELYLKLKQYDRAERTLAIALDHKEGTYKQTDRQTFVHTCVISPPTEVMDLSAMMDDTRHLLLLARVYLRANRPSQATQTLNSARDMQSRCVCRGDGWRHTLNSLIQ